MNRCERQSCEVNALLRRYGLGELAVQFGERDRAAAAAEPAADERKPRRGPWRLIADRLRSAACRAG